MADKVEVPIEVIGSFANLLKMGKEIALELDALKQKQAGLKEVVSAAVQKLAESGALRKDIAPSAVEDWSRNPEKLAQVIIRLTDQQQKMASAAPNAIGTPVDGGGDKPLRADDWLAQQVSLGV